MPIHGPSAISLTTRVYKLPAAPVESTPGSQSKFLVLAAPPTWRFRTYRSRLWHTSHYSNKPLALLLHGLLATALRTFHSLYGDTDTPMNLHLSNFSSVVGPSTVNMPHLVLLKNPSDSWKNFLFIWLSTVLGHSTTLQKQRKTTSAISGLENNHPHADANVHNTQKRPALVLYLGSFNLTKYRIRPDMILWPWTKLKKFRTFPEQARAISYHAKFFLVCIKKVPLSSRGRESTVRMGGVLALFCSTGKCITWYH